VYQLCVLYSPDKHGYILLRKIMIFMYSHLICKVMTIPILVMFVLVSSELTQQLPSKFFCVLFLRNLINMVFSEREERERENSHAKFKGTQFAHKARERVCDSYKDMSSYAEKLALSASEMKRYLYVKPSSSAFFGSTL
jgi:hypothetical protein